MTGTASLSPDPAVMADLEQKIAASHAPQED
jgi:hypothetical protein